MKNKTVLFLILVIIFCSVATAGAESPSVVKIGSDLTIEEGTKVHNVAGRGRTGYRGGNR